MDIALVSDTHIPSRAAELPPWVRERVGAADHTIHAGDFDSEEALATVRDLADGDLTAVRGNMDDGLGLPEVDTVRLGGVEFVLYHGAGSLANYRDRVAHTVTEAGSDPVGVCGHTHQHMDEVVRGVRLLNPGSATAASPAEEATMMTVTVDDGEATVRLHHE